MNINRIGMYGIEIDNFFNSDNKEYILEKNQEFINWYNQKLNEGFHSILTPKQIQHMIEKIVLFFEFKYHDKFLIECIKSEKSEEYYKSREIAKTMDMEELKYRLHHDYLQFLNCSYASAIILKKKKENPGDVSMEVITFDDDGIINEYDLENLKESNYVQSIEGIETASDLLTYFSSNPTTVNYSELEKLIFNHKTRIELRNKILELIPLAMLYSRNSLPIYSYIRAKSFVRMFNKEYNLDLDTTEIDEIMGLDYRKDISKADKEILTKRKIKRFKSEE